jgi:hypothetical protein
MNNLKPASSKIVIKLPGGSMNNSKIGGIHSQNENLDKSILDKSKDGVAGFMEAFQKQKEELHQQMPPKSAVQRIRDSKKKSKKEKTGAATGKMTVD